MAKNISELSSPLNFEVQDIDFIKQLAEIGGPEPEHYEDLSSLFARWYTYSEAKQIPLASIKKLTEAFGEAMSPHTMQGFSYCKPHGYAGDFEIIDGIYLKKRLKIHNLPSGITTFIHTMQSEQYAIEKHIFSNY